jgi:hypothetical protein
MELWQIAVRVGDAPDRQRLLRLLRDLHVPMDPCAGDPRWRTDADGVTRLLVVVTERMREQLRAAGRSFETVRDLRDLPDPIRYVSKTNRYADELARVRAAKGKR